MSSSARDILRLALRQASLRESLASIHKGVNEFNDNQGVILETARHLDDGHRMCQHEERLFSPLHHHLRLLLMAMVLDLPNRVLQDRAPMVVVVVVVTVVDHEIPDHPALGPALDLDLDRNNPSPRSCRNHV
jgi:hypothetical protein